ncbi:MAG: hypothetical protein ACRDWY_10140 [Actinomycetes bacterium]
MASGAPDLRAARGYGIGFAVLFTLALTVLLGELVGAFADDAESFPPYFDTAPERLRHALGAYLLVGSGLAFLAFTVRATAGADDDSATATDARTARLAAAVFAALVGLASAALATVSLSVGFGQVTGDPGIREAQELLPQLGYVVLMVPAALSAALAVWLVARLGARTATMPEWVAASGYVVAAAQLLSFYSLPLALLPLWVLTASLAPRRLSARS